MCDPLTIIGGALSVGSAIANSSAANQQAKARDQTLAAERIRQRQYDAEAQGINTRSQDRYEGFEGQREQKAQNLTDFFTAPPATADAGEANATAGSVMPSVSNDIVVREMDRRSGQAREFTDRQGAALGQLRAFGDLLGDTSRLQARDASLVGQIGGFKRGSSNVLPLELEAASQRGSGARMLGDILGGIGGLAMNAGISGGGFGGAFGASAAAPAARAVSGIPMPPRRPASLYPTPTGIY